MIFKELYSVLKNDVLFKVNMADMILFKGTKNQFEKVKNKEYKGMEFLKISSLELEIENENEQTNIGLLIIKLSEISLFNILSKESD